MTTLNTLDELNKIFYDVTVMVVNQPEVMVRHSWPSDGAPAFSPSDDVVFIKIYDVASPVSVQQEVEYIYSDYPETYEELTHYTRTLLVNWVVYGQSSWSVSTKLRNGFFYNDVRYFMRNHNLYMIPNFNPPMRAPELFQGRWYERADLSINFNEQVRISRDSEYIQSVPISFNSEGGLLSNVEVTENLLIER